MDQVALYELSAQEVGLQDSFLSLAQKMNIGLPPELFQAYLSRLQQDNTDEQFQKFQTESPRTIRINQRPQVEITQRLFSNLMEQPS